MTALGFENQALASTTLVAAFLPLVIHLLTRPRATSMPLSTIRFLRDAMAHRRKRNRVGDLTLLVLRTLCILALGLSFSRPQWSSTGVAPGSRPSCRVLILDVSRSMALRVGPSTLFERARVTARRLLTEAPAARTALVLAGARPVCSVDAPTTRSEVVMDDLSAAQVRPERLDAAAALAAAARLLDSREAGPARELVVLSDFQRADWVSVEPHLALRNVKVRWIAVSSEVKPTNVAILRIRAASRLVAQVAGRLEVEVAVTGPLPTARNLELKVGPRTYSRAIRVAPGAPQWFELGIEASSADSLAGTARLTGGHDDLPDDDVRCFAMDIRTTPRVVLITRDRPRGSTHSAWFLEKALLATDPDLPTGPLVTLERAAAAPVDADVWAHCDVLVLCRAGRLESVLVRELARAVRAGKGLVVWLANEDDATTYNELAQNLASESPPPVRFVPLSQSEADDDRPLIARGAGDGPLAALGPQGLRRIGRMPIARGLVGLRPPAHHGGAVLANHADGSVAILGYQCGRGMVAALNVDLERCDLVRSGPFVPLVHELVAYARGSGSERPWTLATGSGLEVAQPPTSRAESPQSLTGPDGRDVVTWTLARRASGDVLSWGAEQPGHYWIVGSGGTRRPVAVDCPPEESDLATLGPESALFQGGLTLVGPNHTSLGSTLELSAHFLAATVLLGAAQLALRDRWTP